MVFLPATYGDFADMDTKADLPLTSNINLAVQEYYQSGNVLRVAQASLVTAERIKCNNITTEEMLATYCKCQTADDQANVLHLCMGCRNFYHCATLLRTATGRRLCQRRAGGGHFERELPRVVIALNLPAHVSVQRDHNSQ